MKQFFGLAAILVIGLGIGTSLAAVVPPSEVAIKDAAVPGSLTGQTGDPAKGREVFAGRSLGNCLACHQNPDLEKELFHGNVGPSLAGVADRYVEATLRAIVVNAKEVFGPETVMPAFYHGIEDQRVPDDLKGKPILTAEQVEDLVAYLKTLKE